MKHEHKHGYDNNDNLKEKKVHDLNVHVLI